GTINGILVADAGSTVTPGLPTGTLAVSGSATLNGAVSISLNRTNIAKNGALTASSITASGALTVTNLGPDLVTGDTFALFNHPVAGFATINLPVQNADGSITYQWQNNIATDGTIKVLSGASAIATNPTNITFSVGANQLTLTWPGDHLGWKLQSQTNALSTGLTTNWYDVPGSTTVTQMIMTVSPADPTVFYRLMYQVP
ncbi:MAG TPA: hypothetical protein VK327_07235, partial [Candidatus Paceibacterota bacterium]|nr:hypothetical protein [Candidatus Paceibacterota bacterium]